MVTDREAVQSLLPRLKLPPELATGVMALGDGRAVPWDRLADTDGWVLWLGHPPVPDRLPVAPLPDDLRWGDPPKVLAGAAWFVVAYAAHRGATDPQSCTQLLRRESPLVLLVPEQITPGLDAMIAVLEGVGLPVLRTWDDLGRTLAALPSRRARQTAHAALPYVRHDPALSWQAIPREGTTVIGGNSLSSYILHNEPEREQVLVTGDLSERMAVEIGVAAPDLTLEGTAALEVEAARIPSFLDGVGSAVVENSLQLTVAPNADLNPARLGGVIAGWLHALHGAEMVDVRLAFAPPQGRSALLVDMRARAKAFRDYRTTGEPPE